MVTIFKKQRSAGWFRRGVTLLAIIFAIQWRAHKRIALPDYGTEL
jgi:hypothetical protein